MKEHCTVALRLEGGAGWDLNAIGPSPVNATLAANDLTRELLAQLRRADGSLPRADEVRFGFHFRHLITFSYVLEHDVVKGLADMGALVSFHHYDSMRNQVPMERLGSGSSPDEGCEIALRICGVGFDPEDATRQLGVTPSSTWRLGEPRNAKEVYNRDGWLISLDPQRFSDPNQAIIELLDRLPTTSAAWLRLAGGFEADVLPKFTVQRMTGYYELTTATMRRLADGGCHFYPFFIDYGPRGLDCLDEPDAND